MSDLSKDDILNFDDLKVYPLVIPEWGGNTVYLRQLSGKEQDAFEAETRDKDGKPNILNIRARLAVAVLVDKDGNRMFSKEDVQKLANKSGIALNRIIEKSAEINRITEDDLEAIAKNS
jgi:hypothetical protein